MYKKGKLTGVGIGPGDPELITVKGMKALESADVIFYPASKLEGKQEKSFSVQILAQLGLKVSCRPLLIPMNAKNRETNYQLAFEKIKTEVESGKKVVMVAEGDVLFYSTFGYILKLAETENIPCGLIPGIPAFIAAGSAGRRAIVEGANAFEVIARPESFQQIEHALRSNNKTVVVMKMSVLNGWGTFLQNCNREFLYAEGIGTSTQFLTTKIKDISEREIPYFSLITFYA